MSRRARNQTSVSLFPFLAVLLCAMGALLVLLVITTRQIRDDAIRQAASQIEEAPELPASQVEPPSEDRWPEWNITLGPAEDLERKLLPVPPPASLLAPKPVFVTRETEPPPPDLTAELQRLRQQIQRAGSQLADERRTAEELQKRRVTVLAELQKRETILENAGRAIEGFQSQRTQLSREVAALEQKSVTMTRELQQLQAAAQQLADRPRNSQNVLKVVPYEGRQGTTRRPILIECRENTIQFVPEGIELTERDLIGFSFENNPLLAGVKAAEKYWMQRDRVAGQLNRPYVLLIVRPDGIPAYYAARQLLQHYQHESGYELLNSDQKLALPELDPDAQQQIAQAVQGLLQQRGGTPSLARSPFPQVDPERLRRLRSGEESLTEDAMESGGTGSQPATPGGTPGKKFKFVQTSQGLKMVPVDDPALKSFDPPGGSRERKVGEVPATRPGNSTSRPGREMAEPPPLPALPEGTRIKSLTADRSGASNNSGLNEPPSLPSTTNAAPEIESRRDPSQVPDAWTPLLEARRREREQATGSRTGQQGSAAARSSSQPSAAMQGLSSPFGSEGTLAFKRTIEVRISGTHLKVANRTTYRIPEGLSTDQLLSATILELSREVKSWKEPPEQFYWKPAVRFVVYPGGNQYVERLRPKFEEQGLLSGVDYQLSEPATDRRPTQP